MNQIGDLEQDKRAEIGRLIENDLKNAVEG